jgi:hypothetical protein
MIFNVNIIFQTVWDPTMCALTECSSTMCFGPTNALVCNKTLIQMSHIKTLKITPICFDHQLIIIRELLILVKNTG